MEMEISFPKNQQVKVSWENYEITTDQLVKYGGDGEFPEPYKLFLASVASCGGYYLLKFCEARNIDHQKIKMKMVYSWKDKEKESPLFEIKIKVPEDFDEKYIIPLQKAVEQCAVKRAINSNPIFQIFIEK